MSPAGMRQGVCLELAEVIQCSLKRQLDDSVESLVVAVEDVLCDAPPEVRHAAGGAFDVFHKSMGYRSWSRSSRARCFRTSCRACSRRRWPCPTSKPSRALRPSRVLHYHIDRSLQALFNNTVSVVTSRPDDDRVAAIQHSVRAVALSVEAAGVQWLAAEICKYCETNIAETRYLACWLIAALSQSATVSYVE
ncbi:hypothetical protein SPRG_12090 [Saprolegnia parasitica CBS 223.65]|uniref:Stalled ribosome sensor GCN1-like HEAT repeats region domain-containing protein n=1 Tax=Saprolegnia parasitica (strain CBS 223.65) TaxID=695850 RepID=A0A067C6U7_SAPPC|nr:hypothetical protein SPRG_12090 [Saprolegnia parasitica CBS 223.65]KDO22251.1 hypothetical protein SPRG_12090 [Saprolegnia parasitica CBS 223.65]|eukprot:XP_012206988.1 hypothetical protein SPRG_12090 [Saprolegnia parasitica CBS 223.65]